MTSTQASELSIHAPSAFLQSHWPKLLPHWPVPVQSVLIYLQFSAVPLCDRTPQTETAKQRLRQAFLEQAQGWHHQIIQQGYLSEPFDPKSGTPLFSEPGVWPLDDVAVAHALLDLPIFEQGGCKLLRHPNWKTAVFPATLLSSAPPQCLMQLISPDSIC